MTPKDVINHYGGTVKAAAELSKSPRCIENWLAAGKISYWNQCAIQTISGGQLKAAPERAKKSRGGSMTTKEKCKHCGKSRGDHNARTMNCPLGLKHRVLGYTGFHPVDVFKAAPAKRRKA